MWFPLGTVLDSLWERPSLLFLYCAVFLILSHYLQKSRRSVNYPPGPPVLPIVGNYFQMDWKNPEKTMKKFTKQYGDIYCMHVGNATTVMVTGLPLIKEVLINQGDVFIDRPIIPIRYHANKSKGLVMSNGPAWKQQRRFTLMTLRNFGLGKKTVEYRIQEEARYLIEAIREEKGQPFDPQFQINNAVSNIICSITFGNRFEYHDAQFQELLKIMDEILQLGQSWECQLFNIFPRVMKFLPGSHQKMFGQVKKVETFVENIIKQHKEDLNPEETHDYIDAYLKELSKDNIHSSFEEKNLVYCTLDLFFAGTETTSSTLRWGMLYVAIYPEIQGKIQAEIDRVVGQSRQPTIADRENMPYTNAAIHDIQRMGNIIPFNVARVATGDTTLGGYDVPKGTIVMTNLTALHRDPKEWATPETFNPEHFLENGQFKKKEAFLPFSTGKRVCLGEQLARAELFLFFTCLLQNFTFQAPPKTQLSLEPEARITRAPLPFNICAIPRAMQAKLGL